MKNLNFNQKIHLISLILIILYFIKLSLNYILGGEDTFFQLYMTLPIFLLISNLFIKNWTPLYILCFILLNNFLSDPLFYGLKNIYYFLNNQGLFNFSGLTFLQKSNDYLFVILYLSLIIINFGLILKKGFSKTRGQFFILLASSSIFVTTTIFHYITINQYLNAVKQQQFTIMENIINDDTKQFLSECEKLDYLCLGSYPKDQGDEIVKEKFSAGRVNFKALNVNVDFLRDWIAKSHNAFIFGVNGFTKEDTFYYLYARENQHLIIAKDIAQQSFKNAENWFHFLCFFAHTTWLNFMCFLILFHERKKWWKAQNLF